MTTGGGVVRYRLRATLGRRVPGLAMSVALIGLLGGVSLASFAAARRTQSSYATFLASTKPSDLTMSVYGSDPASSDYSPSLTAAIARLPQVTHVESWVGLPVLPLARDGSPRFVSNANVAGSVDGSFFDQDRATAVQGRLADPRRDDEFETTAVGAALFG